MALKKYRSLSGQAEDINERAAYFELIEHIRTMSYEELYDIMTDTETALTVLIRGECAGDDRGIVHLVQKIIELAKAYLAKADCPSTEYTFEYIDRKREEGKD